MDALLNLVPDHELLGLLHGLRVFDSDPDEAHEWRLCIMARLALLRLPDDVTPAD